MSIKIQDKLLHYELSPPEGTWNKIAATLDNHPDQKISEKLYGFEEEPSQGLWNQISQQLHPFAEERTSIPFYKKYHRPLRYSSAAVLLIIAATIVNLLISKKTVSEVPASHTAEATTPIKHDSAIQRNEEEPMEASVSISDKVAHYIKSKKHALRVTSSISPAALLDQMLPRQASRTTGITDNIPVDNYMVFTDAEGKVMRLPKKLFDAFACPPENYDCREKIKKLQQQAASAALTSDFGGVLEMLRHLEENQ
ncbi:MAG: hypothetical protein ACJ75B_22260 [Flavisolibacter sp.]